jgi:ferric-dicitrate binding protein FerR (iron transport regulator)
MKDENDSDYLWDRSGEPDADVARLERALGRLRHAGRPPAFPAKRPQPRRLLSPSIRWLAAAALVLIAAGAGWFVWDMRRGVWDVRSVAGTPVVEGRPLTDNGRLRLGEWLVTDAVSRATVAVARIGRVEVFPNTRVQLVESKGREHRMALDRGTIHARIWAPPKFFYVSTQAAEVIDLGCEYTLQVDDNGAGLLRVSQGWVEFNTDGREAFIPQGAMCATRPGVGPGTPRYEDAPSGYGQALDTLDFGAADVEARGAALDVILSRARPRDAFTLWHLLSRGSLDERRRVFDRLAALAPPPNGVTREAILGGDKVAAARWWDSLGVTSGTWWRLLKKKW